MLTINLLIMPNFLYIYIIKNCYYNTSTINFTYVIASSDALYDETSDEISVTLK